MNPSNVGGAKSELRKTLIRKRKSLGPALRGTLSRRIARAVNTVPEFKAGARVALYLPFGSEVDTAHVMQFAKRRGIKLVGALPEARRHRQSLPVVPPRRSQGRAAGGARPSQLGQTRVGRRASSEIIQAHTKKRSS